MATVLSTDSISCCDPAAQQVWFSAAWSNATCIAFRRALAATVKEQQPGAHPLSSKVMAILNLWQVKLYQSD